MLMMTFVAGWIALAAALSAMFTAVGLAHQSAPEEPLADLEFRLRRPVLWSLAHPVRAILRHYGQR